MGLCVVDEDIGRGVIDLDALAVVGVEHLRGLVGGEGDIPPAGVP